MVHLRVSRGAAGGARGVFIRFGGGSGCPAAAGVCARVAASMSVSLSCSASDCIVFLGFAAETFYGSKWIFYKHVAVYKQPV